MPNKDSSLGSGTSLWKGHNDMVSLWAAIDTEYLKKIILFRPRASEIICHHFFLDLKVLREASRILLKTTQEKSNKNLTFLKIQTPTPVGGVMGCQVPPLLYVIKVTIFVSSFPLLPFAISPAFSSISSCSWTRVAL